MKNNLLICTLFLFAGVLLSGCNTVHGVGTDIERGGQAIERAAGGR